MKKVMMIAAFVALAATGAQAISAGPGGYIYWSTGANGASTIQLWRAQIDSTWTQVGSNVNFDCVASFAASNVYAMSYGMDVEVLDPRMLGGTGKLLVASDYNGTPGGTGSDAYDVVRVDPTSPTGTYTAAAQPAGNLYTDGRAPGGTWDTMSLRVAMAAPANWIGQSNGISIITEAQHTWFGGDQNLSYLHDQNGNGTVDAVNAEGTYITTQGAQLPDNPQIRRDMEFGADRALYTSYEHPTKANVLNISRYWSDGTTVHRTTYYDNASDGIASQTTYGSYTIGDTLAVGPGYSNVGGKTNTNAIVYVMAYKTGTATPAIWAMQDKVNGDNVVSTVAGSGDTFVEIWEQGQAGIKMSGEGYEGWAPFVSDIEIYVDPDNQSHRTLLFAGGRESTSAALYALDLTDNGLMRAGNGKQVLSSFPTENYLNMQGFELDMNGTPAIPEPATLLLVGTGALGALGWIRRRRVK